MKYNSLILFIPAFLFFSCSSLSVLPDRAAIEKELKTKVISEHFIFHFSEGDSVNVEWEEEYYQWLSKQLNITAVEKIDYYKYKNAEQKFLLMKSKGNAITLDHKIHTIFPYDNHELVHVLVGKYIGNPPKLFTEGIAVAHQTKQLENGYTPTWNKEPIDKIAKEIKYAAKMPPLDSLLLMNEYFKYDANITYPVSGSFTKYLLDLFGYQKFYDFIENCDWMCSSPEIKKAFAKSYGLNLNDAWSNWLDHIGSISFMNN